MPGNPPLYIGKMNKDTQLIYEAYLIELFDKPYMVSGPQPVGGTIMYTFHTDPNEDGHSPPIYVTFDYRDFMDRARTLGDAWDEINSHIQEKYPDSILPENVEMQEFGFGQSPDEDGDLDYSMTGEQGHSASKLLATLVKIAERHSSGKYAPHILEISASNAPAEEKRGPLYRKLVERFIAVHPEWGVIQSSSDIYDKIYVYNKNYVPWLEDEKLKEFIELP